MRKQVQYMDGLRVPLIVYDNDDYFDYDEDEVITLSGRIKSFTVVTSKLNFFYRLVP